MSSEVQFGRPQQLRITDTLCALALACLLILPGLWSFTLIDPWEGHYAEVARRMLQDNDWIALRWQSSAFHSKPALAPWLIAASLELHGFSGTDAYSGEFLVSPALSAWAVRFPFALFGVGGLYGMWLLLAKRVSKRAGYLALLVLGTTPFYALVARQAITDMPMVATSTGALCCFGLAITSQETDKHALRWPKVLVLAVVAVNLLQTLYAIAYFERGQPVGPGMHSLSPSLSMAVPSVLGNALLLLLCYRIWPLRGNRDGQVLAAWALLGVGLLAKGPPGAVLVLAVALLFLVLTKQLRLIFRLRPLEGLLIVILIALPWHLAIALRDGMPFLVEYIGHHWLKRAGEGVHMVNKAGEGSFTYFTQHLGYGLWPFLAIVPAALRSALRSPRACSEHYLRLLGLLWAVVGFVLFTLVRTKYHHYILPAVPGFALIIALWMNGALKSPGIVHRPSIAMGLVVLALASCDMIRDQTRLIELFTYRYDRPWPSGAPWHLDLSGYFVAAAIALLLCSLGTMVARLSRFAVVGLLISSVLVCQFVCNVYSNCGSDSSFIRSSSRFFFSYRTFLYEYGSLF